MKHIIYLNILYFFCFGVATADSSYTLNNEVLSFAQIEQKAIQGNVDAQFYVGYILSTGDGVKKDVTAGIEWYKKASKQGHTGSMFNIAYLYEHGDGGIEKNQVEAVKWLKLAANNGNVAAQNNLGDKYYKGDGVKRDYKEATKWYALAIKSNMLNPYVSLGKMFFNGEGVAKDHKTAYILIYSASLAGYLPAKEFINDYQFELTPEEKTIIQNQVLEGQGR